MPAEVRPRVDRNASAGVLGHLQGGAATIAPPSGALTGLLVEVQRLLRKGDPGAAEGLCRQVLAADPEHADGHNLLGVALAQQGRTEEAEGAARQALARRPSDPGFLLNHANRLIELRRSGEAIEPLRLAHRQRPRDPVLVRKLARSLATQGIWQDAIEIALTAFDSEPEDPETLIECGRVLAVGGRDLEAPRFFEAAVDACPERSDWWLDYARLCHKLERFEPAKAAYQRVIDAEPGHAEARTMLAAILHQRRDFKGAQEILGGLRAQGLDAANLVSLSALMMVSQAQLREGLDTLAMLDELAPDALDLQMTRVMYQNYDPDLSRDALFELHRRFGERFGGRVPKLPRFQGIDRDPERRLRVGYVSADFHFHSVAFFLVPILEAYDRDRFEVHAYANVQRPDPLTVQIQGLVDHWHDVTRLDDRALAEKVRSDGIDILVDLGGLTGKSRVAAFTGRPAPVQISYLGYPNTTGLAEIDYRIVDHVTDPRDADAFHTETLIRLPRCFLCYGVPREAPEIGPPPVLENGFVTFGSFNNTNKINPGVVAAWARVLNAVPGSRLLLKSTSSADATMQANLTAQFAGAGLDPERVRFVPYADRQHEHLQSYNEVDIALDTFPYNGATTTCEALWMGVPVITLVGDRHAARVGASLLGAIGFDAGITTTVDDYVETARLLAGHPRLLETARRRLRYDLSASPLCDKEGFTRTLEEAYRAVWHLWCADAAEAA